MLFQNILTILGLLYLGSSLQKSTPLRLDDLQTQQIYVRLDSNDFKLYLYKTHFIQDPVTVFCFRQRVITPGKNNMCDLTGLNNPYKCLEMTGSQSNNAITGVTVYAFDSDSTLSSTAKTNQIVLPSTSIVNGVAQVVITITSYLTENNIYEAYAGYQVDLGNDLNAKNAFFNTFKLSSQTSSDDLLAQRHPVCFQFFYENYINYNIVFFGGAIRGGNNTMFFHVLSFFAHENRSVAIGSNLNGYIGISWSQDHGDRDMAAFITANSTLFDMFSLYYSAPFLDQSINIEGTDDILSVADSASHTNGANSHYFYGGFIRQYDTLDSFGDEMIRKKMNNSYCIAVGFHNLNNSFPYSPLLPQNKHIDTGCFNSIITLWDAAILLPLLLILCLTLL